MKERGDLVLCCAAVVFRKGCVSESAQPRISYTIPNSRNLGNVVHFIAKVGAR
jgi:hypothetical protein